MFFIKKNIWKDVKKAKNFKEAFMYIFGPPGWSADGSTLTVKEIQKAMKEGVQFDQTKLVS